MSLVMVFPGQGSQSQGMLADCAANDIVQNTFAEASDALGLNLWQLCQENPDDKLNQTQYTQPALLTASTALYRLWVNNGGALPSAVAGHSLGEYSALVSAGAMNFPDAVTLVSKRGEYMQAAVPAGTGAMAAIIGMSADDINAFCADMAQGQSLSAANINAPGQVVIAGAVDAVERAVANAKPAGAKLAKQLPVSVPSHCELMRPAAEQLAASLADIEINAPNIPVLHNVDAKPQTDPDEIRQRLVEQLYSPVQWVGCVTNLYANDAADQSIEIGAGKVLTGLNKRINKAVQHKTVNNLATLEAVLAAE